MNELGLNRLFHKLDMLWLCKYEQQNGKKVVDNKKKYLVCTKQFPNTYRFLATISIESTFKCWHFGIEITIFDA